VLGPIRLTVLPDAGHVVPGGSLTFSLTLRNAAGSMDRYQLAISGVPESWLTLDQSSLSLAPGASETVTFTMRPPSAVAAGDYPITVQVVSDNDPQARASQEVPVSITATAGLGMDVSPVTAQGKEATFRVSFTNADQAPATVVLDARDDEGGLDFRPAPAGAVTVPPGGQATVQVEVHPHNRETIGEPHPYDIEFRGVREGTSSLTADPLLTRKARFTYEPRYTAGILPVWLRRLPIWALLLLPLLLLGLVFLVGNRVGAAVTSKSAASTSTPQPATTPSATPISTVDFSIPATVQPGTTSTAVPLPVVTDFRLQPGNKGSVSVHWQVSHAGTVLLNGKQVSPSGAQNVVVTTDSALVLSASNESGTVSQVLHVIPPPSTPVHVSQTHVLSLPTIQQFTAQPDAASALHLVWHVLGADTVTMNGQPVAASGSQALPAGGPSSYVIKATNVVGTVAHTLVLPKPAAPQVNTVVIRQPTIVKFTVVHQQAGQPYMLVWQTTDATSVALNGRQVPPSGSQALQAPIQAKSYQLVARNADGLTQAQIQVTVQ
jgi:hypothetical protein